MRLGDVVRAYHNHLYPPDPPTPHDLGLVEISGVNPAGKWLKNQRVGRGSHGYKSFPTGRDLPVAGDPEFCFL